MSAFRLRKFWRDVHLWIGICLTIVFIPLGLSGSWLVFDDAFDHLLHPHRYQASVGDTELPASRYLAAAQQAFGARIHVAQLRMPEDQGQPAVATAISGDTAWLDPVSGKVLDQGNPRRELRAMAHQFHETLFMARTGRQVVGWLGVAMFISSVTGLITWWPRNNALLKALRWRRSPLVWSNIHHLIGFWSCLFLAILSLTGVTLAFPQLLRPGSDGRGGGERFGGGPRGRFVLAPPLASPHLTADQAVDAAEKSAGASDFESVRLPTQSGKTDSTGPAWQVVVLGQEGPKTVLVDDQTGQARASERDFGGFGFGGPPRAGGRGGERGFGPPPAARAVRWLHAGNDAPMIWRVLIFVVGLVPTILGVTGVVVWLRTRRRPELQPS